MRTVFPRERGGKAPQIGPGTFDARSGPSSDTRPTEFRAVAYSSGPAPPAVEIWAYLKAAGHAFEAIAPTGSENRSMWLDRVGDGEAFTPASSLSLEETARALKTHANDRYYVKHGGAFQVSDWAVQIARPFNQINSGFTARKFGDGFFRVEQLDFGSGPPTAWVWVEGYREIWVHYIPGEVGGFCFVGTEDPRTTQMLTSSTLRIKRDGNPPTVSLTNYGAAIAALKAKITTSTGSPTTDPYDLVVHDFRVLDSD